MERIEAEKIKRNDTLYLWFGKKLVSNIVPYDGTIDFILNVIVFSDGTKMSNEKGAVYNGNIGASLDI